MADDTTATLQDHESRLKEVERLTAFHSQQYGTLNQTISAFSNHVQALTDRITALEAKTAAPAAAKQG